MPPPPLSTTTNVNSSGRLTSPDTCAVRRSPGTRACARSAGPRRHRARWTRRHRCRWRLDWRVHAAAPAVPARTTRGPESAWTPRPRGWRRPRPHSGAASEPRLARSGRSRAACRAPAARAPPWTARSRATPDRPAAALGRSRQPHVCGCMDELRRQPLRIGPSPPRVDDDDPGSGRCRLCHVCAERLGEPGRTEQHDDIGQRGSVRAMASTAAIVPSTRQRDKGSAKTGHPRRARRRARSPDRYHRMRAHRRR